MVSDLYVVDDTLMHHQRLGSSHTYNPISTSGFPIQGDAQFAMHSNPQNLQSGKTSSKPFLRGRAAKKDVVKNDVRTRSYHGADTSNPGRLGPPEAGSHSDLTIGGKRDEGVLMYI